MDRKGKILIILSVIGFIIIATGISYAYFTAVVSGNESASTITLNAGELEVTMNGGESFTANHLLPSNTTPWATKTITLTGKNDTDDLYMRYTLKLVVDYNSFSSGSIKYTLTSTNTSNNGSIIASASLVSADSSADVGSGYFRKGTNLVHTYVFAFYFPETGTDQSSDMGASYTCHFELMGTQATTS